MLGRQQVVSERCQHCGAVLTTSAMCDTVFPVNNAKQLIPQLAFFVSQLLIVDIRKSVY